MIKHIVMLKLFDKAESATKAENAIKIKNLLDELPSKIKEIQYYEVGLNIIDSERAYDLIIVSEFKDLDSLFEYVKHPEHQKVVEYIEPRKADSKSVDYKVD